MLKLGDFGNLQLMLGVSSDTDKRDWGCRKSYSAIPGSSIDQSMERLAQAGLVKKVPDNDGNMYVVTFEGAKVAGLSSNKIRELKIVRSE